MPDLELDAATSDLVVDSGRLRLISGAGETRQRLELSLGLNRGDWFRDLAVGVNYRGLVFASGVTESDVGAVIRGVALRDSDVVAATASVTLDSARRDAEAIVQAELADGVVVEVPVSVLPTP